VLPPDNCDYVEIGFAEVRHQQMGDGLLPDATLPVGRSATPQSHP